MISRKNMGTKAGAALVVIAAFAVFRCSAGGSASSVCNAHFETGSAIADLCNGARPEQQVIATCEVQFAHCDNSADRTLLEAIDSCYAAAKSCTYGRVDTPECDLNTKLRSLSPACSEAVRVITNVYLAQVDNSPISVSEWKSKYGQK